MINTKFKIDKFIILILVFLIFFEVFITTLRGPSQTVNIIIPILFVLITIFLCFIIFNKLNKLLLFKFFIISLLTHIFVSLFINIVKYQVLGYNEPTEISFSSIKIDDDGRLYHREGVLISNNLNLLKTYFNNHFNNFSYLVGIIYKVFGINEFAVCCINSLVAGFIPILIYLFSKKNLTETNSRFLAYLSVFSFSILANTSILTRDVYIIVFMYASLYSAKLFYEKNSIIRFLSLIVSIFILFLFRPYAAANIIVAIGISFLIIKYSFKYKEEKIKIKKSTIPVLLFLLPIFIIIAVILVYAVNNFYIYSLFSIEDLLESRDVAYGTANTEFNINMALLMNISPVLGILVGYICMFFAPFPWTWFKFTHIFSIFYVIDTIILYLFLPLFFRNIKKVLKSKNFVLLLSAFTIFIMFLFYGIILKNAGAIFRLRGPFLPLIFFIALYSNSNILLKIKKITLRIKRRRNKYA